MSAVQTRDKPHNRKAKTMKIKDLLKQKRTISCEFFPPREAEGIPNVMRAVQRVRAFNPDYVSVTYGAGGSTRAFTEEITTRVKHEADLEVMAHLTCVGQTSDEIHHVLERLDEAGIENVIALRGDPPRGETDFVPVEGGFEHATDLIEHIRQHFTFGIAGACYPEGHVESVNMDSDLDYVKRKVDLGADFLVTQLFYDNRHFYDFMERAERAGIDVPIVPGVLPILSAAQIRRFTSLCGASDPGRPGPAAGPVLRRRQRRARAGHRVRHGAGPGPLGKRRAGRPFLRPQPELRRLYGYSRTWPWTVTPETSNPPRLLSCLRGFPLPGLPCSPPE